MIEKRHDRETHNVSNASTAPATPASRSELNRSTSSVGRTDRPVANSAAPPERT
jgi:hypothetical protein